jgi:hypothetical protein
MDELMIDPDLSLDGQDPHPAADFSADPELLAMADELALSFADFIATVEQLATDGSDDELIALLLLSLSAVLLDGARLGAMADVVPAGRFEPDCGREPDLDRLRLPLHSRLTAIDAYDEVFDPYDGRREVVSSALSDDLATIVEELLHGLGHHRAGRRIEAMWWWQFSYISSWGASASAALRAIQSLVAHVRLGAPLVG